MAKLKSAKIVIGDQLAEKFGKANAAFVAEYRGMKAEELNALRRDLRAVNSQFTIVKNRLAKKAVTLKATDSIDLSDKLRGPVGVAYIYGDVAAGAKALFNFSKTNKNLVITGGVFEGKLYSAAELESISELPSKEVLMARLLGTLVAPHRRLMGALKGVSGNLVRTIGAIKDKKA
jgi:large subunit ribosomal protein L10